MRPSLHIERRVNKLADSKMSEILIGIAENLLNPKPRFERVVPDKWPLDKLYTSKQDKITSMHFDKQTGTWSCDCTFCQLHIVYTYLNIEYSKAGRGCTTRSWCSIETLYFDLNRIKVIKHRLENLPMDSMLADHIKDAKVYIGKYFDELRSLAREFRCNIDELINHATKFIHVYGDTPNDYYFVKDKTNGEIGYISKLKEKKKVIWF